MLIVYLYGLKSERRIDEQVTFNLSYRWFYDPNLMQRVPDHLTFSQNRKRRLRKAACFGISLTKSYCNVLS
uniref:transposase n=1 Tax=Faecalicatena contorta TaxID=39482 RepID=UPI00359C3A50